MTDLYAILGVDRAARAGAIKEAYRRKAKEHHPDAGGDPDRFHELSVAYTILSDPERRKEYDLTGEVDAPKALNVLSAVTQLFARALDDTLEQTAGKASELDMIRAVRGYADDLLRECLSRLAQVVRAPWAPRLCGPVAIWRTASRRRHSHHGTETRH